jgi:hypothetical protein
LAAARAAQGSTVLSVVLTGFCRYSCNDKHVSDTTSWVAKRIPNVSHVMVVRIQVTTIIKEKNLVHLRNVDTANKKKTGNQEKKSKKTLNQQHAIMFFLQLNPAEIFVVVK